MNLSPILLLALIAGCPAPTLETRADADADGHLAPEDCDDANAGVFPDAEERCNGLDDNCDGTIDEGVTHTYYLDGDGDGAGAAEVLSCQQPQGTAPRRGDCDDADPSRHPGQLEICNGLDDDCDGDTDEGVLDPHSFYEDLDGDGFGGILAFGCPGDDEAAAVGGDCDDEDPDAYPDATEVCDEVDNNCDGTADEGLTATYYSDIDDDGFGGLPMVTCRPESYEITASGDCDDIDDRYYPGSHATEIPGDGTDVNCDGHDACTDLSCDGYPDLILGGLTLTGQSSQKTTLYQGPSFSTVAHTWDVDGLRTLATGDFNRDGYLDVALPPQRIDADYRIPTYVFPGLWAANFGLGVSIDTAAVADSWAGDLNGDGADDLVLASSTSLDGQASFGEVLIYYGGVGGLSELDALTLPAQGAWDLEVADLNQDGDLDLAVSAYYDGNFNENPVMVYYSDGGLFDPYARHDLMMDGPLDLELADFNEDGFTDILALSGARGDDIASARYDTTSCIWWGSAAGFSASSTPFLTEHPSDAVIDDFNGDGWLDFAIANAWSDTGEGPTYSTVYWGSPLGFSEMRRTLLPSTDVKDALSADLDGDGFPELVLCNHRDSTTYLVSSMIYWGSAGGYSAALSSPLPTRGCRDIEAADLDADDDLDLIFAASRGNNLGDTVSSVLYWNDHSVLSPLKRVDLPRRAWVARAVPNAGDRVRE